MASLVPLVGPRKGEPIVLKAGRNVLGRDPECEIVIKDNEQPKSQQKKKKDSTISRKHTVITCDGGTYYIEDGDGKGKKSRNGTFLNGQELTYPGRFPLRHRDQIRLCDLTLLFVDESQEFVNVEASLSQETSVTSLKSQSAEKLQVLLELSNSLSTTFDVNEMLPRITDGLFKLFELAERCFVMTRESPGGEMKVVVKTCHGEDEVDAFYSSSIVRQCMESVQAILGSDLPEQFPNSESVIAMNARSLMCAPLWSHDRQAVGAIQLDTQRAGQKFTEPDLKLLLGVASQVSISLNNTRLHGDLLVHRERERDLQTAHEVQLALLPSELPAVADYDFYACYESAQQIGGDYYDFVPLSGNRLAIVLGDVAGKGIPAALIMAKFGVEARVCLELEADLATAFNRLNTRMARSIPPDRFVTVVAVVLDLTTHMATIVNAGHLPPLLIQHATGKIDEVARTGAGMPIGVIEISQYVSSEVPLAPGDQIVLFSDGVTEAMDGKGKLFGSERLNMVVVGCSGLPKEMGKQIIDAVKRHSLGVGQNDDITLVTVARQASK